MKTSAAVNATRVVAIGLLLTACSGGSRVAASAGAAAAAAQPPLTVRCGEAPVPGPPLRTIQTHTLGLPGTPDGIATTPDGRTSFVALQSGPPRIAVIDNGSHGERLLRTIVVPGYPSGVRVTPDGRDVVAAAGRGVVVIDAIKAASGAGPALLGSLAVPAYAGAGPGAAEVAVSPDSRYVFVTLEGAGVVAVFDLRTAIRAGFGSHGYLGAIPVGAGALGIAFAPDGRRLYEVSESVRRHQGALSVIDFGRAVSVPAKAVMATAPLACAPVRVAVSPDGTTLWVTARDANDLLGFSAATLVRNPAHALVSVTRIGAQPLGLAVVDGGRRVLVADSNLSGHTRSAVSVVDASSATKPKLLGSIPAGKLADAISAPGTLALVTNSGSKQLETLELGALP